MNEAVEQWLLRYNPTSREEYELALKEILQEIVLLGLSRADFFSKAAFYGGSALRILHGLDRFSEDLDFTLLSEDSQFSLSKYFSSVTRELEAYGFSVTLERVQKDDARRVESAFLKLNTRITFLEIVGARSHAAQIQKNQRLKIKFEVDTDAPAGFDTEMKTRYLPSPFTIKALTLPSLFAGKMHAALFRQWKNRVKGRDFYDLQWHLVRKTPLKLGYLARKVQANGAFTLPLTKESILGLLAARLAQIDWTQAKADVAPFLKDPTQTNLWSAEFFQELIGTLTVVE